VVARADDFNQGGSLELGIPLSRMACASRVTPGIGSLSILMVRTGWGQKGMLRLCGGL